MITYEVLDKKYIRYIVSKGIGFQRIISYILGSVFFITDFFSKYEHNYKIISRVFPKYSILKKIYITYMNYINETFYILNYGWLIHTDLDNIKKVTSLFKINNINYFKSALSKNKPIVFVSAHIGCFFQAFFLPDIFSNLNRKISCLAPYCDQERKKIMENKINIITNKKFEMIDITSKYSGISILRNIKKDGIIACNMDYAYSFTRNKEMKFLNKKKKFPTGIIELGLKYDAIFIPIINYVKNGKYIIEFDPFFELEKTDVQENDVNCNLKKVVNIIETKVVKHPSQWTMWKSIDN